MTSLPALTVVSFFLSSVAAWPWSDSKNVTGSPAVPAQPTAQIPPSPLAAVTQPVIVQSSLPVYDSPKKDGVAVPAGTEEYTGAFGSVLRIIATIVHSFPTATTAPPSKPVDQFASSPVLTSTLPSSTNPIINTQTVPEAAVPQLPVPMPLVNNEGQVTPTWNWNASAPDTLPPNNNITTTTPVPASAMAFVPFKAAVIAAALLVVGTLLL